MKNKLTVGLLSIAFIYVVLLLSGTIKNIIDLEILINFDKLIGSWINSFQSVAGIKIFSLLTLFGKSYVIIFFTIITTVILWLLQKKWQIVGLLLSLIGSEAFTYATKLIVDRPRPEYAVYLEHSGSFPSGHSTVAVAFYGFLIYLLPKYLKTKRERVLIISTGSLLIILIGFSRLYLGVHYLSDILIGYLIGLLWLCLSINLTKKT